MKLSRQRACCLLIALVALAAVPVQAQELRGRVTGVVIATYPPAGPVQTGSYALDE